MNPKKYELSDPKNLPVYVALLWLKFVAGDNQKQTNFDSRLFGFLLNIGGVISGWAQTTSMQLSNAAFIFT